MEFQDVRIIHFAMDQTPYDWFPSEFQSFDGFVLDVMDSWKVREQCSAYDPAAVGLAGLSDVFCWCT